jgi:hypothetical protein
VLFAPTPHDASHCRENHKARAAKNDHQLSPSSAQHASVWIVSHDRVRDRRNTAALCSPDTVIMLVPMPIELAAVIIWPDVSPFLPGMIVPNMLK